MPKVFQLGFVEFPSADVLRERAYYVDVLGARLTESSDDGTAFLSLGADHHNIALRPARAEPLPTIGYRLNKDVSLDQAEKFLEEAGVGAEIRSDARPGIAKLVHVAQGPGGYPLEFFNEMTTPAPGFGSNGVVPLRLGHIALVSPDAERMVKFYSGVLGFHTTDWFEGRATFMTCNRDHHVLNIVNAPAQKLHHIAFELRNSTHQFEAADFLARVGVPVVWGPSRHTAGHNLASYHYSPDKVLVELYADMDVYLPDAGYCEPRPWHEELPLRPRVWRSGDYSRWATQFEFDFRKA
jgi:catechol 2,3-dioxygenase-like lactoylglutathione lyase family enzyme